MEELDILDSNKAAVAMAESSVGSIGSQSLFGDKSAGLFEDIEQFKELTNPVQVDE